MNRVEFMRQLEQLLQDIPESDRLDAIAYYNDYFDEAGPENEAQVIRELGSPGKVAAIIKEDLSSEEVHEEKDTEYPVPKYQAPKKKRNIPWVLIIVLIIFASPVLVGVGGGLLGGLIGVIAALAGIIIAVVACGVSFLVGGIVLLVVGIVRLAANPIEGLVTIGIGSILLALGIVFLLLFIWCVFKWIPALFRSCVNLIQRLFHRERKEA